MEKLEEIKTYFKENKIEKEIVINGCEKITDVNKTVASFIFLLEARKDNPGYKPYYKKLLKIWKKLK